MRQRSRWTWIGALFVWGYMMQPIPGDTQSAGLEITGVNYLPEYVIGFPIYVAITVQAQPDVWFNFVRLPDFTSLKESIGADITAPDGSVIAYTPQPLIDDDGNMEAEFIEAGETRRMLLEVAPLFGSDPTEGEYTVRFAYVTPREVFRAAPVKFRLRKPTEDEQNLRALSAPDRASFPNWSRWSVTCPKTPLTAADLKPGSPLAFSLALRFLFCGSGRLERVDPAMLDNLGGVYAPERDALKAELYAARADYVSYQRLRSETLAGTPGLAWWFRMIDEGGAFLKSFSTRPR